MTIWVSTSTLSCALNSASARFLLVRPGHHLARQI